LFLSSRNSTPLQRRKVDHQEPTTRMMYAHLLLAVALVSCSGLRLGKQVSEEKQLWIPSLDDDVEHDDAFFHAQVSAWRKTFDGSAFAKRPAPEHKPLWFVHLHQTGNFMRMAAEYFGEKPLSPHAANWDSSAKEDMCTHPMACEDKHAAMVKQGASYTATERSFLAAKEHCPKLFLYGISIANPTTFVHKSLSSLRHRNFELADIGHLISILKGEMPDEKSPKVDECRAASDGVGGHYPQYDNFIIRTLLGHEVFWSPPGSITKDHLAQAKEIIQNFDVILPVDEKELHFDQLEEKLRWSAERLEKMSNPPKSAAEKQLEKTSTDVFDEEQTEFLDLLNRFDQELYEFATVIARKKSDVLGDLD